MSKHRHTNTLSYIPNWGEKENVNWNNLLSSQVGKPQGWKRKRQGSMGEIDPFSIFTPVRQLSFDDDSYSLQEKIARRVEEAK